MLIGLCHGNIVFMGLVWSWLNMFVLSVHDIESIFLLFLLLN